MTNRDRLPPQSELSLYLHIPFCTVKCGYCDFFSISGAAAPLTRRVTSAILEDAKRFLGETEAERVPTVYLGGGTPTVLPLDTLSTLLEGIGSELPGTPNEWTVEVNPETVTPELLDLLRDAGVDRISVGVQALREEGLRSLGRATGAEKTVRALEEVRSRWSGRWNADLIVGYAGDTPLRVEEDAESLLQYGASHVSVYALTVEPETPLARQVASGTVVLPGDDEVIELLESAGNTLSAAGVERYEISNYARPGEESLHNLRYWSMEPYLGVGPAAASTLYEPGSRPLRGLRLEGTTPIPRYLGAEEDRYQREQLSPAELLTEHLLMGLRTRRGVSLSSLSQRFNIPLEKLQSVFGKISAPDARSEERLRLAGAAGAEGPLAITPQDESGETPSLYVPRSRWNLLDHAVFKAVEAVEGLL